MKVKGWPLGQRLVSLLDQLTAWPKGWRERTEKDDPGDPMAKPPRDPAPPTGPRCLGVAMS